MAVTGTYYIDGATLALATAAYTDAALTIPAPDGYYSDGSVVRRQVGGVFVTSTVCESCSAPCGSNLVYSGTQGIYTASFDAGLSTGCVIIYFRPNNKVHGIRAKRGALTYNKLTSVFDGYHGSTVSPNNYTFVGNAIYDCGVAATLGGGGYSGLDEYQWNGSIFALVGSSGVVTGAAGDVSYSAGNPSWMTLRVPKAAATPRDVSVEIVAPCANAAFDLQVACPVLLTAVQLSEKYPLSQDPDLLCDTIVTPYVNTYYSIPNVGGTPGVPALYEFLSQDPYGSVLASNGYYKVAPNIPLGIFDPFVIRVQNGVIDFVKDPCPL